MKRIKVVEGLMIFFSLFCLSFQSYAADFVVDGIAYDSCAIENDNKSLYVVRLDEGAYSGDVSIPQSVHFNGTLYHVVAFSPYSYDLWDKEKLTSVTIEAPIEELQPGFFRECTGLKQVNLPTTITTLPDEIFSGCTSLSKVTVSEIEVIGSKAFEGCTSFTSFSIPSKVKSVADDAFYGCTNITSLRIEDSKESINFRACRNAGMQIESLYVGRNLLNEGEEYSNTGWDSPNFGLLNEAQSLKAIEFGSLVTSIPNYTFYGCTNLKDVLWGCNITTIGESAFLGCSSLDSISLSSNKIKTIGGGAFEKCTSLQSVVFGDSISNVGAYCLSGCSSLASATLPNGLRVIPEGCFENCTSLTSMVLPESIDTIESHAFAYSGLTDSLTIPRNVKYIGECAFRECTFSSIRMGAAVKVIGNGAFEDCSKIRRLYYDGTIADWCGIDFAPGRVSQDEIEVLYEDTPLYYVREFRVNGDTAVVTDIVFPDSVKKIPINAFQHYRALKSITIPASVDSICTGAFAGCKNLTIANVSARFVQRLAFSNSLNELHLACNVELDNYAFPKEITRLYYEGTLEQFCYMKRKVKCIEEWNENFSYEYFEPSIAGFSLLYINNTLVTDITLPAVEKLDAGVFYNYYNLKSVSLPSNMREIGDYAFGECSNLQKVDFYQANKESSTSNMTIGENAFSNCSNLEMVDLPASYVKELGNSAFEWCTKLKSITCADNQSLSAAKMVRANSAEKGLTIGNQCFYMDSLLYDMSFLDFSYAESISSSAFTGTGWEKSLKEGPVYLGSLLYSYKGEAPANTVFKVKEGTKTIVNGALNNQAGITAITFPISLLKIEAALGGTGITSLTIPTHVEKISEDAFCDMSKLSYLKFDDSKAPLGVTGATNMYHAISLDSVKYLYVGRTAEWQDKPDNSLFDDCVDIISPVLEELVIGEKVNHVNHRFYYADSLFDITVINAVPPTSEDSFVSEAERGCTLHVLASALEDYKNTAPWCQFFNIEGESYETLGIYSTLVNESDCSSAVHYNMSGMRISPKEKGLHIIKFKNGMSKKIVIM